MNFAKKYGLVGKGHRVVISDKTKNIVREIYRKDDEIAASGKKYLREEKRFFN